ncbi:hypothetical protein R2587_06930, partial [Streptococcus pyogenes]
QLVYQENRKRSVRPIRQRKQDREAIEHWINHYPKRLFNYKSPIEMLKLANFNLKFGSHNFILFSHIDTMVLNELIGVTHNHF